MARKLYEKVHEVWKDRPDETTPCLGRDLMHIEQGIYDNSENMALKEIYGDKNMSLGFGNSATGSNNAISGASNTVNGDDNSVFGIGNKVGNANATSCNLVSGNSNEVKSGQGDNFVSGAQNIIEGSANNIVGGLLNSVKNAVNYLIGGTRNTASGSSGIMSGILNEDSGSYNAVFGLGNKASGMACLVSGKYNEEDTNGQYAQIIGGGTSDERKNIHTVDWHGNAVYAGDVINGNGVSLDGLKESIDQIMAMLQSEQNGTDTI